MAALDGGTVEIAADAADRAAAASGSTSSVCELIDWHEPKSMAIESIYFGKNVRSAMAVGQASGVAMLAAAERGVPCFDYTPQAIKMAVCGSGGAAKKQVQRMVGTLLGLPRAAAPTTPPTRSRSRSATRAPCPPGDQAAAGRRAAADDRRGQRRGPGRARRPRRHRRRRRRLPARGLRRDAEDGAGGRRAGLPPRPADRRATTRSRSTASPPRRSATSSGA